MGLQLIIKEVILNDVSKVELPGEAEELDRRIASCRERLMILAAMEHSDHEDGDGNVVNAVDRLHQQVSEVIDELQEATVNRHLVGVALSDLDSVKESY